MQLVSGFFRYFLAPTSIVEILLHICHHFVILISMFNERNQWCKPSKPWSVKNKFIVLKQIELLKHFHLFQLTRYRIHIFQYKTLYFYSYLLVLLMLTYPSPHKKTLQIQLLTYRFLCLETLEQHINSRLHILFLVFYCRKHSRRVFRRIL